MVKKMFLMKHEGERDDVLKQLEAYESDGLIHDVEVEVDRDFENEEYDFPRIKIYRIEYKGETLDGGLFK